jgi:REP element-mobilizing transposase RayT
LAYTPAVPRLNRCYGHGFLHFITFSCYHRLPLLRREPRRDLFLRILEQVRRNYRFVVVGYVVMPEHVHLLLSEPERADPGTVVQVLKQRFARTVLRELRGRRKPEQAALWNEPLTQSRVWQARFYDFLVYTKRSAWKSCTTCIAIRWLVVWYLNRSNGPGAASVITSAMCADQFW